MTIAKKKADPSATYATTAAMLADAATTAVGLAATQLTLAKIPADFWDGTSNSFAGGITTACGNCLLTFVNNVLARINSGYLALCDLSAHYTARACLHSISDLLINFNGCNDPTGTADLVSGAVTPRCRDSDLVAVDVKYGFYKNLVSKALYDRFYDEPGFENAIANLPCKSCFTAFVTQVQAFGRNPMLATDKCGPTFGKDLIYSAACWNQRGASGGANDTISGALTALGLCLGGSLYIPKHATADFESVCSPNEQELLAGYNLYDPLVQCAVTAPAAPYDTTTHQFSNFWLGCMTASIWGEVGLSDLQATQLTCAGCLGFLTTDLSADALSGVNPTIATFCTGPGLSSFSPKCVTAMNGRNFINVFQQCSGVLLSTEPTACSTEQMASISTVARSAIPAIQAAVYITKDSSTTALVDKKVKGFRQLLSIFGEVAGVVGKPCKSCYQALVYDLVGRFSANADLFRACANEFSSLCLEDSRIQKSLASFNTCAGFELRTDASPYACSKAQAEVIRDNQIPRIIYDFVIGKKASSAAQAVSAMHELVREVELAAKVDLTCASCFDAIIVDLFTLDDVTKAACAASATRTDCLAHAKVQEMALKYLQCSGQVFDLTPVAIATDSTSGNAGTDSSSSHASSSTSKSGNVLNFSLASTVIAALVVSLL